MAANRFFIRISDLKGGVSYVELHEFVKRHFCVGGRLIQSACSCRAYHTLFHMRLALCRGKAIFRTEWVSYGEPIAYRNCLVVSKRAKYHIWFTLFFFLHHSLLSPFSVVVISSIIICQF